MNRTERRLAPQASTPALRRGLNDAQCLTLNWLESFGWELKFVRHPLFQPPIVVVRCGRMGACAVIESDGTLNRHPRIVLRH